MGSTARGSFSLSFPFSFDSRRVLPSISNFSSVLTSILGSTRGGSLASFVSEGRSSVEVGFGDGFDFLDWDDDADEPDFLLNDGRDLGASADSRELGARGLLSTSMSSIFIESDVDGPTTIPTESSSLTRGEAKAVSPT